MDEDNDDYDEERRKIMAPLGIGYRDSSPGMDIMEIPPFNSSNDDDIPDPRDDDKPTHRGRPRRWSFSGPSSVPTSKKKIDFSSFMPKDLPPTARSPKSIGAWPSGSQGASHSGCLGAGPSGYIGAGPSGYLGAGLSGYLGTDPPGYRRAGPSTSFSCHHHNYHHDYESFPRIDFDSNKKYPSPKPFPSTSKGVPSDRLDSISRLPELLDIISMPPPPSPDNIPNAEVLKAVNDLASIQTTIISLTKELNRFRAPEGEKFLETKNLYDKMATYAKNANESACELKYTLQENELLLENIASHEKVIKRLQAQIAASRIPRPFRSISTQTIGLDVDTPLKNKSSAKKQPDWKQFRAKHIAAKRQSAPGRIRTAGHYSDDEVRASNASATPVRKTSTRSTSNDSSSQSDPETAGTSRDPERSTRQRASKRFKPTPEKRTPPSED